MLEGYQFQRNVPLSYYPFVLINGTDCPVALNCSIPKKKASDLLEHHLQPLTKSEMFCIKDTNDFTLKLKNLNKVPNNATLVTMLQGSQGCDAMFGMGTQTGLGKKNIKNLNFLLFASHDLMGCEIFTWLTVSK